MEQNMKRILTKRQQEILDFIESFMQERGYPPTLREIGNEFGIRSTNGVRVNLAALEKKQYIRRRPWLSRGIEIVSAPKVQQTDSEVGLCPHYRESRGRRADLCLREHRGHALLSMIRSSPRKKCSPLKSRVTA